MGPSQGSRPASAAGNDRLRPDRSTNHRQVPALAAGAVISQPSPNAERTTRPGWDSGQNDSDLLERCADPSSEGAQAGQGVCGRVLQHAGDNLVDRFAVADFVG